MGCCCNNQKKEDEIENKLSIEQKQQDKSMIKLGDIQLQSKQQLILPQQNIPLLIRNQLREYEQTLVIWRKLGRVKFSNKQCQGKNVDLQQLKCQPISIMQKCFDVIGDNRQIIKQKKYPYSAIGCLIARFGHPKIYSCFSTASIIYKNFILTCAHNVYDRKEKQLTQGAIFIPFLVGTTGIRFDVKPQKIHFPNQYKDPSKSQEQAYQYDYAVIQVEADDLSLQYGSLGLNMMTSGDRSAMIYGYTNNYIIQQIRKAKQQAKRKKNQEKISLECPKDSQRTQISQYKWLWGTSGLVDYEKNNKFIEYKIPTNKGQSGSAIIRKIGKNNYQIIGIHQRTDGNVNFGISIIACKDFINSIIKLKKSQITIKGRNFSKESFAQFTQSIYNWYYKQITKISLVQCSIKNNMITEFINNGKSFLRLTSLDLSNNAFDAQGIKQLTSNTGIFPNLQILILNDNDIRSQGVKQLIKKHYCFPSLKGLFLSNNSLDQLAIKYLTKNSKKQQENAFPFLDKLQLGSNYQSKPRCKSLGILLEKFPNLTKLGLRKNWLRDKGLSYLSNNGQALTQLTHLYLGNNFIADIREIVKSTNKGFLSLIMLSLQYNQLNEKSLQCLSQTANFPSLVQLHLWANYLKPKSMLTLLKTEGCFPHLQILDLRYNQLGKQGCAYLSDKRKAMPELRQLNLSRNNIADQGIFELKKNIGIFPKLIRLNLSENNLTAASAKYLMNGDIQFSHLQILQLQKNSIGDQGIDIFCKQHGIGKVFKNLTVLNLSSNGITSEGFIKLVKNRLKLKKLTTLKLSQNNIDQEGTQFMANLKPRQVQQFLHLKDVILQGNSLNRDHINRLSYCYPNLNFGFPK